ncbi:hypothetical protein [Alphaentomopoxvirus acuprea]|uniref:Uncharacterized protein n=1 Tax=Alphaentomopoxvirus acuprea TaxID=62099 RepID=W6JIP8_9POXV|nr:hypothetical protein BA82_gp062 [Anomala cuprea entomopoxvirus]BAO49422.1 hypothetical protein [Anomala cuprea entomopoxvirus]
MDNNKLVREFFKNLNILSNNKEYNLIHIIWNIKNLILNNKNIIDELKMYYILISNTMNIMRNNPKTNMNLNAFNDLESLLIELNILNIEYGYDIIDSNEPIEFINMKNDTTDTEIKSDYFPYTYTLLNNINNIRKKFL